MENDDVRCANPNCQIVFPKSWADNPKSLALVDDEKYFCGRVCWHEYFNIPMKGEVK